METVMETTDHWSHQAAFSAEPTSALRARDFISLHLLEHDLVHLVDDMRLTVSELATNAVRHAQTPFTVTLENAGASVVLSVEDGSPDAPAPVNAPDPLGLGGRGLSIVAFLSRDWGVTTGHDGTKAVWASFDGHGQGGPGSQS